MDRFVILERIRRKMITGKFLKLKFASFVAVDESSATEILGLGQSVTNEAVLAWTNLNCQGRPLAARVEHNVPSMAVACGQKT